MALSKHEALHILDSANSGVDEALKAAVLKGATGESEKMYKMLAYFMGFYDEALREVAEPKGGKRFRPGLCLYLSQIYGVREKAFDAAVAIELFHNFTLVHDDVEDRDEMRRNRPTVWKLWGINHAINAGDMQSLIVADACLSIAKEGNVGAAIASAILSSAREVIEGQYMDFELADAPIDSGYVTEERCLLMTSKKTGALVRLACDVAGLAAGVPEDELKALRTYGESLGLAFQIADDYRSVWSTHIETGKDTRSDVREHKRTLPFVTALDRLEGTSRSRLAELYSVNRQLTTIEIDEACTLINSTHAREYVLEQLKKYAENARHAAESLRVSEEHRSFLVALIGALAPESI